MAPFSNPFFLHSRKRMPNSPMAGSQSRVTSDHRGTVNLVFKFQG